MKNLLARLHTENILMAVLGLLLLIAVLLMLLRPTTQITDNQTNTTSSVADVNLVDTNDIQKFTIAGVDVTLPAAWALAATLSSPEGTTYVCAEQASCQLYIAKTTDHLAQMAELAFAATPVKVKTEVPSEAKEQVYASGLGEFAMTVDQYIVVDEAAVESGGAEAALSYMPLQISGCTAAGICITSGVFSFDPAVNVKQVAEFEAFLAALAN